MNIRIHPAGDPSVYTDHLLALLIQASLSKPAAVPKEGTPPSPEGRSA